MESHGGPGLARGAGEGSENVAGADLCPPPGKAFKVEDVAMFSEDDVQTDDEKLSVVVDLGFFEVFLEVAVSANS